MSQHVEDRLRAALHAAADAQPVPPGAYGRNADRLRERRRRTAAGWAAAAAAAVLATTAGVGLVQSDKDTVGFAGAPGEQTPRACSGPECAPAPDRFTGPVLDTFTVDGQRFDVLSRDGDDYPVYTICTATEPRSCGQIPATEASTQVAVPTSGGRAMLFVGLDGNARPEPGDSLLVRVAGAATDRVEPDVTFVETPLLDYAIAAFPMPTFEPLYCITVVRDGQTRSNIGLGGVNNPAPKC